ncbi:hypothetical protein A0H81_05682, partial [Grifola frondosa]
TRKHLNILHGSYRDEVGLVRAIAVKCKEIFRRIQVNAGANKMVQLLIDMRVRWSSTYLMLHRAESKQELSTQEWARVKLFLDLLRHANNVQQGFSSDQLPSLHLAIPALEALHKAWSSRAECEKYQVFSSALHIGVAKIEEYYNKTECSDAYIVSMYLVPETKGLHFEKYWSQELQVEVKEHIETIFKDRYNQLHAGTSTVVPVKRAISRTTSLLRELSDDEDDNVAEPS